jgi:hypothetical protein
MKLRIRQNSLRLRLNRSDVEQFRNTGICAGVLRFGPGSQLTYTLETSSRWTVISLQHADESGPSVLIEKDFQCLNCEGRNRSEDADSFPNPLAAGVPHVSPAFRSIPRRQT